MDTITKSVSDSNEAERLNPLTSREGILEDLLESEELQNAEVHTGVVSETAFVRSQSGVELHAEASVHLQLSLVILPSNSELNDPLWYRCNLEGLLVLRMLFKEGAVLES